MGPDPAPDPAVLDRRRALAASAAVLGAAGFATACGATSGSGSTVPTGNLGPVAPPAGGDGSAGTALGPVTEVPVGGGKIFEALEVVVTQPTAGRYSGFSAVCTHTGCIVTTVTDGTINCPCHGSRYRLDGTVAAGPAPRPLRSRPVTVTDGELILD